MFSFSNEVQEALKNQGWSPDRKILIDEWVARSKSVGMTILPEAEKIWQNFGGLTIKTPDYAYTHVDATWNRITEFIPPFDDYDDQIMYYEERIGIKITLLGITGDKRCRDEYFVGLAECGHILFLGLDSCFIDCAKSFELAMEIGIVFAKGPYKFYNIEEDGRVRFLPNRDIREPGEFIQWKDHKDVQVK